MILLRETLDTIACLLISQVEPVDKWILYRYYPSHYSLDEQLAVSSLLYPALSRVPSVYQV